jgi:flagellar hook-associated protein 1 FlgK
MVSTYHGIETGRRALSYFRKGMEISGVNTTKTNTAGYSRQTVNAAPTPGLEERPNVSMLGTGVEITSIQRMRDIYLDSRFVRAGIGQVYWAAMAGAVSRVEKLIVDAGEKSLNNYLDGFWTAMQDVHKYPDDKAIRNYFLKSTINLTDFANSLAQNYTAYRDELNSDIKSMVKDANSYIDQIAILNEAIRKAVMAGAEPNELLDKRDLLAERLCILTGAEVSRPADELDGDYKINLNGKLLVQGTNTRHLMLVENPTNRNYYDVQVEYNQYDVTSDLGVAGVIIENRAAMGGTCSVNGTHELDVKRVADELYWAVGHGLGQSAGGERIDGLKDPDAALNINGSFALQVGSAGVRVISEAFSKTPPGQGVVLGPPGPGEDTEYTFRLSAGSFEATVSIKWNGSAWDVTDNFSPPNTASSSGAGGALTVTDLGAFLSGNYSAYGLDVGYQNDTITIETRDRQIISINDLGGSLMRSCGLANKNPAVKIEVLPEDSLRTIVNKINNAYMFDRTYEVDADGNEKLKGNLKYETDPPGTSPGRPEEWLRASLEFDENGDCYIALTSDAAGEANRINVLSGSVCGGGVVDMTVARLLGFVDETSSGATAGQGDVTAYIQYRDDGTLVDRYDQYGDVYADDAWVICDGREFLSSSNEFKDARRISEVGWAAADALSELIPGVRFDLNGAGHTTITVQHHLTRGAIFASAQIRDDFLLSQMDVFDDMMYRLASEFNAIHYAGYGSGAYADTTGIAFFERIKNKYGAFGKLEVDPEIGFDESRLAASTGDGKGHSLGAADGTNALSVARLKQMKLFHNGIANFDDLYACFDAELGAFGQLAKTSFEAEDHVVEQLGISRESVMGVNADEEMLRLVEMNQGYNYASQYVSTLIGVLNQIISGVGRVGL